VKVIIVCHYFYPEIGAPSSRWLDIGKVWAASGHEVLVITAFPNHPTGVIPAPYRGKLRMTERIEGMTIHRNYVYATPNEGIFKKTIGHLSFMISSVLFSLFKVKRPDVVIVSSPTLFSVVSGYMFSLVHRAPFVFEVRDLWPDAIVKLGMMSNRFMIRALEKLEMFMYERSRLIVTVTEAFKRNIVHRGIARTKVEVITNGVDVSLFHERTGGKGDDLATRMGWHGYKVLLYAGAHGISQGLSTLLDVAKGLQDEQELLFVFIGEGAEKKALMHYARELQLTNVQFLEPLTDKEQLLQLYHAAYVSFVPLRNLPLFDDYIPSKMFEILASGCPIIASISGEAAEILRLSGGAMVVPPEQVEELVVAVRWLVANPDKRATYAEQGRQYVQLNYSRQLLAEQYMRYLEAL
jgi:glycosyltransferase involved in cell wall biosynthesis